MTIRILIVDDHPVARDGLAAWIATQPDMCVCGEASNSTQAAELLKTQHPDVVVLDIQLEAGSGLHFIAQIKNFNESIGILVWSMFGDEIYAERALQAGALGYINKQQATNRIAEAIRRVHVGRIFLSEEMAEKILASSTGNRKLHRGCGAERLTNLEFEVFRLIGEGLTTSQIADSLHRSVHTVESHRTHIKDKLGLKTAGELCRTAVQWMLENHGQRN